MRKLFCLTILSLGLLLQCFSGHAQERSVSGTVTGDGNTPLVGVTVAVKGTNRSTQTDQQGRFVISARTGETLHFSYVGYTAQDFVVGQGNTVAIKLATSAGTTMEDVVVVGYGTQRRGNLTGAVSTVDVNKTLAGRPIADVGRGLQGAASGLSVTVPSGEVGSDPIIKIRGADRIITRRK